MREAVGYKGSSQPIYRISKAIDFKYLKRDGGIKYSMERSDIVA
jgi:hypothetical protein